MPHDMNDPALREDTITRDFGKDPVEVTNAMRNGQQVFDLDAARVAREEALNQVEGNAEDAWWASASAVVTELGASGELFTTDDIWARLEIASVPPPHEPRAMGALMRAFGRTTIVPTSEYRTSARVNCHGRPVRVWRGREA